ncbi:MAG TPA: hypothetical protein VJ986_10090 [Gaiellaceae bacterium]|nr:hypothetical protein [Gaiellaceae bacterium]
MDGIADRSHGPAQVLRFAGLLAGAVLVVVAVALAALYLWLRTYAPLQAVAFGFAPGPGIGAAIQAAVGSGGKEVFFPLYRRGKPFDAGFTLHNSGHFAVTVTGIAPETPQQPPWIGPVAVRGAASVSTTAGVGRTHPFRPIDLTAGDTAALVVRFDTACPASHGRTDPVYTDRVRLRYSYLHIFHKTQTVELPFAVTLRCTGGPLAKP